MDPLELMRHYEKWMPNKVPAFVREHVQGQFGTQPDSAVKGAFKAVTSSSKHIRMLRYKDELLKAQLSMLQDGDIHITKQSVSIWDQPDREDDGGDEANTVEQVPFSQSASGYVLQNSTWHIQATKLMTDTRARIVNMQQYCKTVRQLVADQVGGDQERLGRSAYMGMLNLQPKDRPEVIRSPSVWKVLIALVRAALRARVPTTLMFMPLLSWTRSNTEQLAMRLEKLQFVAMRTGNHSFGDLLRDHAAQMWKWCTSQHEVTSFAKWGGSTPSRYPLWLWTHRDILPQTRANMQVMDGDGLYYDGHEIRLWGADAWEVTGVNTDMETRAGQACKEHLHYIIQATLDIADESKVCAFVHGRSYNRLVVELVILYKTSNSEHIHALHVTDEMIAAGYATCDFKWREDDPDTVRYYEKLYRKAKELELGCHSCVAYPSLASPEQQRLNHTQQRQHQQQPPQPQL
jgi:hypothetical protein